MRPKPIVIGSQFDHLAKSDPKIELPFRSWPRSRRTAVLASMRDEGLWLLEWLAHYRLLGFDSIFIYTNDNRDGSERLLEALHDAGAITLIHNVVAPELSPQLKAYRHALWHLPDLAGHEWIAILDGDEFLWPRLAGRTVTIDAFVEWLDEKGASCISLSWRWFPGDRKFAYEPGLLCQRFRYAYWDDHVKSIFRVRDVQSVGAHVPRLLEGRIALNGDGEPVEKPVPRMKPAYGLGQVNHYWQRSFQEFYIKRERGRGGTRRELRDFATFYAGSPTEPEPTPDPTQIKALADEIDRLRALPGVGEAEAETLARARAMMEAPAVVEAYRLAREAAGR